MARLISRLVGQYQKWVLLRRIQVQVQMPPLTGPTGHTPQPERTIADHGWPAARTTAAGEKRRDPGWNEFLAGTVRLALAPNEVLEDAAAHFRN